jgi:hypothetical protein
VLLPSDGGEDRRLGATSVFHGPLPEIRVFEAPEDEIAAAGRWIATCTDAGVPAETIRALVRSEAELPRAHEALKACAVAGVQAGIMHDAKGKEFSVAAMTCDVEVLPSEERLLSATDDSALKHSSRSLPFRLPTKAFWTACRAR